MGTDIALGICKVMSKVSLEAWVRKIRRKDEKSRERQQDRGSEKRRRRLYTGPREYLNVLPPPPRPCIYCACKGNPPGNSPWHFTLPAAQSPLSADKYPKWLSSTLHHPSDLSSHCLSSRFLHSLTTGLPMPTGPFTPACMCSLKWLFQKTNLIAPHTSCFPLKESILIMGHWACKEVPLHSDLTWDHSSYS